MIRGSCCCGGVTFTLSEPPSMMGTCHCTRCRKTGAATFVFTRRGAFNLLSGVELIATYSATPPYRYDRSFCRLCGTALGEVTSTADQFPINAHTIDDDLGVRNRFHEFVAEKPAWVAIGDDAVQFAAHPPIG